MRQALNKDRSALKTKKEELLEKANFLKDFSIGTRFKESPSIKTLVNHESKKSISFKAGSNDNSCI